MREQMQSVQASLQAEHEWRSSEMEGWGSRFAAEREGLQEQLRVEREAAAAVGHRLVCQEERALPL